MLSDTVTLCSADQTVASLQFPLENLSSSFASHAFPQNIIQAFFGRMIVDKKSTQYKASEEKLAISIPSHVQRIELNLADFIDF